MTLDRGWIATGRGRRIARPVRLGYPIPRCEGRIPLQDSVSRVEDDSARGFAAMKKVKALVVDDSRIMRTMVINALDKTGLAEFECEEAEDGVDALSKFDPKTIDIIFVDWNMPRMNGIDFVRKVRSSQKATHIPIIMVTSEQTMGKIDEAIGRAGATAFICKPFTVAELERKVAKHVEAIPVRVAKPAGFFSRLLAD